MKTILVVDDEPDLEALVRQKFRRKVSASEWRLVFARDGQEALETIATDPTIDLVLTDINMPRMDGLTMLGRLQQTSDPVATIVVSAYGDMTNIRAAMNGGAYDFLTKPIDFSDFEVTVEKILRHVAAARDARERRLAAERSRAALARYFSPNLAAALEAGTAAADLSGDRREITAMFTDVAGFTALVEALPAAAISELLNDYVARLTDVVFRHEGTVAKLMGDGLYVLFGAPFEQADHAARAVACALAIDEAAEDFRRDADARGFKFGATRIGVHSGVAFVGDIGGGRFFDYTASGDVVNVASRLEGANKALGTRICVSAETVARIPAFVGRPIGDLVLRGRTAALRTYEPYGGGTRDAAAAPYLAAFDKIASNATDALAAFAALVGVNGDDPLAALHLRRLLNGERGTEIRIV
ncbi:MAG: response regulator [Azospirillum sp.]|nr:response regulator [Azospirillum sp.]